MRNGNVAGAPIISGGMGETTAGRPSTTGKIITERSMGTHPSKNGRVGQPAPSMLLSLVQSKPWDSAVGIGDYPGGSYEHGGEDGFAPFKGGFGAGGCREGKPHQHGEQTDLKGHQRGRQARGDTDEHSQASGDEGASEEISPGQMPWQPARHHFGSLMDKLEMAEAEGDHRQSEEHPGDVEADVAGGG